MTTTAMTATATNTAATATANPACSRAVAEPSIDPGTMPTKMLEDEIRTMASHLAAAESRWLELIAEFDTRQGWAQWGMTSCAQWLAWQTALSPNAARERVRVAHAVAGLPQTQQRFRRGQLSYSKVRALTRVATADNEHELLDLARNATSYQLEQICRAWRRVQQSHDLERAARQRHKAGFTWHWDDDGCLIGRICIPPDEAAAVVAAVDDNLAPPITQAERDAGIEPPTRAQRRATSLVQLIEAGAGAQLPPGDQQTLVVVEAGLDVLANDGDGSCNVEHGPTIVSETARRLCCDATVVLAVHDDDGRLVAHTAPTSSIPRAARRALRRRDKARCQFPGCTAEGHVDAHHLVHRAHGGSHELANLISLCKRHHHLVHEGGFTLSTPDGGRTFEFASPDGRNIPHVSSELPGVPTGDLSLAGTTTLDIDASTLQTGLGERLDLELTIWALCNNHPVGGGKPRQPRCAHGPGQQG